MVAQKYKDMAQESVNPTGDRGSSNTGKTRSQANAEASQDLLKTKVSEARQAIRKSVKAEIIVGGISDALSDIASGNFDDIELSAIEALDAFTTTFTDTHQHILEAEIKDIPLLSASSEEKPANPEDIQRIEEIYAIEENSHLNKNTKKKNNSTNSNSQPSSFRQKKEKK